MSSKTRLTTFKRLAGAGDIAPLLVQLMMAVNDLGIADHGLRYWSENPPSQYQDRAQGAKSYFVRLQIAHTFEALKIIGKIQRTPNFLKLVQQCDQHTQDAFARLASIIGTDNYKAMKRLRDAITFHYETNAIAEAIKRQNDKFPDHPLSLSIGNRTLDWYFEPADRMVDSIIIRDAIGLQAYPVASAEVDKVASRLQTIAEDLANFSGYFIPRYCTR
jgi:hypothetical protein